ncbi:hypothetical protein NQ156_15015 [Microbacterium sp. zg.Y625]|uniref:hypothetical protein n=1 Tax=Microbacterium jiangjiandongii TaxID=3049071 RepID=UPI00214D039D|nr:MULTISPECIES: hypothetical protein [unclassified Microbacterium]MCR2794378.1 hypothetical protein [Microbacterium sp. zg.Y625]MCR2815962.1 hypothetical protein [Microbacterium sp. zg.Y843]WIM26290.1 hypothetical protein QNO14_04345 [Microbacterium sp. zg-Y625]
MYRHTAGAVVGVAALLIALTGCSGSDTGPKAEEQSPLGEYLAAAWGGDLSEEEQQKRFEEDNKQREELVAQCMTEAGFEYIPVADSGYMVSGDDVVWEPDSREWVAQYGYGMVEWPGKDEATEPGEEYVDPNQDYVSSLTESEQNAYYEVLYGPSIPEEEMGEDGSYEWDWTQSGCHGWAQHETEGDDPFTSDEHKPLMDAINEFYNDMQNAPELADLNAEWASCMDDAGHSGFVAQADAQTSMSDELNAYYENQTEWIEDDPALAELAEREVELALADLDCREKTDYRDQQAKITAELEEQFIADHKAELDAFKAAAEQGR